MAADQKDRVSANTGLFVARAAKTIAGPARTREASGTYCSNKRPSPNRDGYPYRMPHGHDALHPAPPSLSPTAPRTHKSSNHSPFNVKPGPSQDLQQSPGKPQRLTWQAQSLTRSAQGLTGLASKSDFELSLVLSLAAKLKSPMWRRAQIPVV